MFRFNVEDSTVEGFLEADGWVAEKVAADLIAISYEDSFFALDELLGWYGDIMGSDPAIEKALTRLAAVIVSGDLELVANGVRDALRLQRAFGLHEAANSLGTSTG